MKPKRQTGRQFTERDVQRMSSNPMYAGVGIYPAMVPEEMWIATTIRAIKDHGTGAGSFIGLCVRGRVRLDGQGNEPAIKINPQSVSGIQGH